MTDHDETRKIIVKPDVDDDGDVAGHRRLADDGPDDIPGQAKARVDADDDDVEGHYGILRSPSSRGE
jgi:hypothetical protein